MESVFASVDASQGTDIDAALSFDIIPRRTHFPTMGMPPLCQYVSTTMLMNGSGVVKIECLRRSDWSVFIQT